MPASLSVHRTLLAQPTRLVMQRVIEAANDGLPAPAQHRIMDPLCDVEPFQRTPAPQIGGIVGCPPAAASAVLRPYGLGQKVFCPLGSGPRVRGSWVKSTPWVMQTRGALAPAGKAGPHAEEADLPSPAGACKCSPPSGLRNRPRSFTCRGTPVPGSPGPRASSFRRPCPCYAMTRPSSASSPRPTLPP